MGVDILDVWRGESISLRRLLVLVATLPEHSRVVIELRRREEAGEPELGQPAKPEFASTQELNMLLNHGAIFKQ